MNKKIIYSGFSNGKATKRGWCIPLDVLYQRTRKSEILQKQTLEIRKFYASYNEAKARWEKLRTQENCELGIIDAAEKEMKDWETKYKEAKVQLPTITVHACFPEGRKNTDPHTFHNTILTDIDYIPAERINELMLCIKELPFVLFVCRSVRGEGIHILSCIEVKGGINDNNFKDVFEATTRIVEYILNIEVDRKVNSISRCMFLNYDEEAYYNPEATPLNVDTALWLEENKIDLKNLTDMSEKEKLISYLDQAAPDLNWTEGNRHHTLVYLTGSLNRAGFDVEDAVAACTSRYVQADFDTDEIEKTVRDVYGRYSSEHGINQQPSVTKKDKGTKGQVTKVSDEEDEEDIDEQKLFSTPCPNIQILLPYIPEWIWFFVLKPNDPLEIKFTSIIAALVVLGAMMKNVSCKVTEHETVKTLLFLNVMGAAASGKSCIKRAAKLFDFYSSRIERESKKLVQKWKSDFKTWEKCTKNCKEDDCNCGAEPQKVEEINLMLQLNTSKSKLLKRLSVNSPFPSLIYTDELDSMMAHKENPLSSTLREIYEGERTSSDTFLNGYNVVKEPRGALLCAGTPSQQTRFFTCKEDGLVSRFLSIFLPYSDYIDVGEIDEDDSLNEDEVKNEATYHRVQAFADYFINKKFKLHLTQAVADLLNDYFRPCHTRFAHFSSDYLNSFIRRLRGIDIRLAMILTCCKLYLNDEPEGKYDIPTDIIKLVISFNDFWIEQEIKLLSLLPESKANPDGHEMKHAALFYKLPCPFTSTQAKELFAKEDGLCEKTATRAIKFWKEHGSIHKKGKLYYKSECWESTQTA